MNRHHEAFALPHEPPTNGYDRLADLIERGSLRVKPAAEKPIAHITVHGDLFCVSCKSPDHHADGHDWLPVLASDGGKADACDECGCRVGGDDV